MSSIKNRRGLPVWGVEVVAVWAGVALFVGALLFAWAGVHAGAALNHRPQPSWNPFTDLFGLISGPTTVIPEGGGRRARAAARAAQAAANASRPRWLPWSTVVAVTAVVLYAVVASAIATWIYRTVGSHGSAGKNRKRVDAAARYMGRGRDIAPLTAKAAAEKASRLAVAGAPGLVIGAAVWNSELLYQDWEACSVDIAGPRSGKSTSRVIPAVMAAPGACLTTSNKRDVVDATRDPRAAKGQVWVFDAQRLVDEPVTWWWNPLTYVTDEARAQMLAQLFSAAVTKADAKTDAYFDNASLTLLAQFLLAAAVGDEPITTVYRWLSNSNDDTAAELLERHGYPMQAAAVRGVVGLNDKQKGGIYGGAIEKVQFLASRSVVEWITKPAHAGLVREFNADEFARSHDTLYSLSKEGAGSAGAVVAALTVAVCQAAEDYAKTCKGGRLPTPMVVALDEVANVCRWPELPNLYSHYGSRGIICQAWLQSWSQGCEVWGEAGMAKLWSAATVKVYGGSVSEEKFLDTLSKMIGPYQYVSSSSSLGKMGDGHGSSHSYQTDLILDVADLAALDPGRMVVLAAGARPTLARQLRWYEGEHAAAISASIAAHDVAGEGEHERVVADSAAGLVSTPRTTRGGRGRARKGQPSSSGSQPSATRVMRTVPTSEEIAGSVISEVLPSRFSLRGGRRKPARASQGELSPWLSSSPASARDSVSNAVVTTAAGERSNPWTD